MLLIGLGCGPVRRIAPAMSLLPYALALVAFHCCISLDFVREAWLA